MITISIIIPTLNRAETLQNTLRSILGLRDLNDIEVIVVDNGSTDNTREVFNAFSANEKITSSYYYDPEPGLLTGRHRGAKSAKGNILCFLDDDVELDVTWLQGVRDAFSDPEVQLATGPCIPIYKSDPPEWLNYFWVNAYDGSYCYWLSLIDLGKKKINIQPNYVFGLNFCIRKDALRSLGGFHPDCIPPELQMYQGDGETGLALKARDQQYKCQYHPEIKLFHIISPERLTIAYFKKRAFYQGVCNSFTELKAQRIRRNEISSGRTIIQRLKRFLSIVSRLKKRRLPADIAELRLFLGQEEQNGYLFHQHAYDEDVNVREWVHKENYWDYKLPT